LSGYIRNSGHQKDRPHETIAIKAKRGQKGEPEGQQTTSDTSEEGLELDPT